MCIVTLLSAIRSVVFSTRFRYFVKAFEVIINIFCVGVKDVICDKAVLVKTNIMLNYLAFSLI